MQWPPDLPPQADMDKLLSQTKLAVFTHKGAGFHGSLLCSHEMIWSLENTTAWCNGETIGFNPYFFLALGEDGRVTLMVHELRHTAHDHFTRLLDLHEQDGKRWNRAADFVINNDLENMGFSLSDFYAAGITPCLDHQYDDMTTEQVYDLLGKNPPMPQPSPGSGQPGQAGNSGSGDLADDLRKPEPGQFEGSGQSEAQAQENAKMARLRKLVQAQQASVMAGDQAGTIPGEVELLIENFLYPVLPWEVLLNRFFTELSKDDYSYKRPNRRYEDEFLPTLLGENGLEHLIYFLDVSGSVSDAEILRFNSEVKYIHEELRPQQLTLVTFDTQIQDVYEFAQDDDFDGIKVVGRGGTMLDPVYEMIKDRQPTAAVIFSDLYCPPMQDPGIPVVWTVSGNPNASPSFGKIIHIPEE